MTVPEPPICEDCGDPATIKTRDGVWLCEGDYAELVRMAESGETR